MKKYTPAIIAFTLLLFASLLSCKKEEKPPHTVYKVGFKTTGAFVVGHTITFRPDDSLGSYLWNFGEGSTSSATSPGHAYTTAGIYTVTMTVATDPSKKVSKQFQIFNDPVYTHLIAGARNWSHVTGVAANIGYTRYNHPDTNFAFSYIDPLTVAIENDTMRLYYQSDSVLTFAKSDTSNIHKQLFFYFRGDSMIYSISEVIHPGRHNFEYFHTKH